MSFDDVAQPASHQSPADAPGAVGRGRAEGSEGTASAAALLVLGAEQEAEWAAVLARSYQHDFHHLAGYHRIAERRGEGRAYLFAYREGAYQVALPLLLRAVGEDKSEGIQDATSVYGYAGPVASHAVVPPAIVRAFQTTLRAELVRRRVVSVFSRLHPLVPQQGVLAGLGEVVPGGLTVSVDLTLSLEEQWAGYSKKCRRIIRRAEESGVVCREDRTREYRREWADMYLATMRRVGAPASLQFDEEYFEQLAAELGPVLRFFVAVIDGKPAAIGLFTICDGIVQAHLGAFRQEYARLSPMRLLDDTARRWAVEAGARVFHLGGGVGGQEDTLFHYKAGFSGRRHEFTTWRWVVDDAAYLELCERRGLRFRGPSTGSGPQGYFPAYRRPEEPLEPSP